MKKNNGIIAGLIIILLLLITTSGCLEVFNVDDGSITYVAHPTKISYTISYGYTINCSGTGDYTINYDCDIPEVLNGPKPSIVTHDNQYDDKTLATYNTVKSWNISGSSSNDYDLGITASVQAESFIVTDLNGANALTIQEINDQYPTFVTQYCHKQSNETITFIDPDYLGIKNTATNILNQADSSNAFVVAKEIFIWLKQNTDYQIHTSGGNVQPASTTFQRQSGDCDDLSFLYISLCRAIDIPARFIRGFLVEEKSGVANAVSHAWVEVFIGGNIGTDGWIPVECAGASDDVETEINQNFGIEDAGHVRLFKDDGSNEAINITLHPLSFIYSSGITITRSYFVEIYNYITLESKELYIDKNGNRAYKN